MGSSNRSIKSSSGEPNSGILGLVYVAFAALAIFIFDKIAEHDVSSILTVANVFQCLAFALLTWQACAFQNVRFISVKSLQLDALAIVSRLASTTWLQGYIPVDVTGDFLYQALDAASLVMLLWLLYHVEKQQQNTQEADEDNFPLAYITLAAFILAALFHGDLNDRPFWDTIWMFGLNIAVVAVVPQLWLMMRSRLRVPPLTCHFVAVMAFSRMLSGYYMWDVHDELTCDPCFGGFASATATAVLAAHLVHLVLLGDFAFIYMKNLATVGINAPLDLRGSKRIEV